jgi:IS30 family transposase
LRQYWSPQQIARHLKKAYPGDTAMRLSHETIYQYLYVLGRGELKEELKRYLRRQRPYRRNRLSVQTSPRGPVAEMISIEERPAEVADRSVPGHWEGDLLMGPGHRSAIGTLVERQTRLVLLVPLKKKDAVSVREAFTQAIQRLPSQLSKSLTYDQGSEMADHKRFTRETQMKVYFCHPHSPWERGTCENTNGLLRQFFPKGRDLSKVSLQEIRRVERLMNGRPRKVLDWDSPSEAFERVVLR